MKNTPPLVSVIVPAYNYATFLAEAVQSTLHQSYTQLEVIIVDDGSTDDTAATAQQLLQQDARVHYIYQNNQGLSAARNTGIKNSIGDFLVFLDADDIMHEHKIAAHLEHFAREPDADISYGDSRYFLSGQPENTFANIALTQHEWMPKVSGGTAEIMPVLIVNNIMPVCSAMLRRRVVNTIGEFDTSLKSLEDWDYWLRAAAAGFHFSYCGNAQLAAFIRVHGISMSQNRLRMLQVQCRLHREHIPRHLDSLSDHALARQLQRKNRKQLLRCLKMIDDEFGIDSASLRTLCRGESAAMLLWLRYRLWRARRER